jgi:hypothetical protein
VNCWGGESEHLHKYKRKAIKCGQLRCFVSAAGAQRVAQINFSQFRSKPNAVGGGNRSSPNGAARAADGGQAAKWGVKVR